MWYSSQKITKTRTSSRAASAAACSGDRIGSDTSSPGGGWPSADTNLNDWIVCGDAVFLDGEIVGGQRRHRLAVAIDDRHVDANQVRLGAERRRLRRLRRLRRDAGDRERTSGRRRTSSFHFDFNFDVELRTS